MFECLQIAYICISGLVVEKKNPLQDSVILMKH